MSDFDVIIIGTGVAGRTAAEEAARAGLRVALVDKRDEIGGTCSLRGCEPKKVLYAASEIVSRARAQSACGIAGDAVLDWRRLIEFKRSLTDPVSAEFERQFAAMGVTVMHGLARFTSPTTVDVAGKDYRARWFLVASGAKPMPLPIPGAELVTDSERFMDLETLPQRIAFIGGGYISFEFAAMARAAGARPIILHRGARPLEGFDPDLVGLLVTGYEESGIEVRLDSAVTSVCRVGEGEEGTLDVVLADDTQLGCDLVVHGAGRIPDVEDLHLEAAGIASTGRGVEVDGHMQSTSNSAVFAAGDAAAIGAPLTPVGVAQARVAVANMLEPGSATFDPPVVPSICFSDPPLAMVGLSEQAAREGVVDVDVKYTDTSRWLSSQRVGLRHTGAKTIVDRASGKLLGAHVLGYHADELVNLFALAISRGVTVDELTSTLWGYPTTSSEIVYLV